MNKRFIIIIFSLFCIFEFILSPSLILSQENVTNELYSLSKEELYKKGKELFLTANEIGYKESIKYFQIAIEKDNKYGLAIAGLAESYALLGYIKEGNGMDYYQDYRNALDYAMLSVTLEPNLCESHRSLSLAYLVARLHFDAKREIEIALSRSNNDIESLYITTYFLSGSIINPTSDAGKMMDRVLKQDPNFMLALSDIAEAYRKEKKYEEAIKCYNQILSINSNNAFALNNLGLVYYEKNEIDMAEEFIKTAINKEPNYYPALISYGVICLLKNKYDEAINYFEKTRALNIKSPEVPYRIGLVHFFKKEYSKAITYFEEAIKMNPQMTSALKSTAEAYYKLQNFENAISYFQKAYVIDKDDNTMLSYLALSLYYIKDYGASIYYLNKIISNDPKDASAYNNLAWLYLTSTNFQFYNPSIALTYSKKACELEAKVVAYQDTLAQIYMELDQYSHAQNVVKYALELQPDNKELLELEKKIKKSSR